MAYVYLHKKDNGSIFYVGKGVNNRAWQFGNRSDYWNRVRNKYGLNVVIFKDNIADEAACDLEVELISAIGRKNLTNLTDGGEGISGYFHSEETKIKIRESNKGGTSWAKGVKFSKEHRDKMSIASKGKKKSKEHAIKNRLASLGKANRGMKVLDTTTDIEYESVTAFCKDNGLKYSATLAIMNGKTKVNKYKHIIKI